MLIFDIMVIVGHCWPADDLVSTKGKPFCKPILSTKRMIPYIIDFEDIPENSDFSLKGMRLVIPSARLPPIQFIDKLNYLDWVDNNLVVLRLEYSRRTRPIPGQLVPLLEALPGNQQPCYCLCRVCSSPILKSYVWWIWVVLVLRKVKKCEYSFGVSLKLSWLSSTSVKFMSCKTKSNRP